MNGKDQEAQNGYTPLLDELGRHFWLFLAFGPHFCEHYAQLNVAAVPNMEASTLQQQLSSGTTRAQGTFSPTTVDPQCGKCPILQNITITKHLAAKHGKGKR